MSTSPTIEAPIAAANTNAAAINAVATKVLVCLPFATEEERHALLAPLQEALQGYAVTLASPGLHAEDATDTTFPTLDFPDQTPRDGSWVLTATDYRTASQLAIEHNADATLILGMEAPTLSSEAMRNLVHAITQGPADFATPCYIVGPHESLVSAAFLHPLTTALFGVPAHVPLPPDAALSQKMAQRLAVVARKPSQQQADPLVWPAAEAALASLHVTEVNCGARTLPSPKDGDLNSLLAEVLSSIFTDIEAKANFWQRARPITINPTAEPSQIPASSDDEEEIRSLVEGFRNAYLNLQSIWSLVLPPQSLLRVKRISNTAADTFTFPADLWARTVYDFLLAFHLRTINRGHLLGALTPLYLAWVASHIRQSAGASARATTHVEETAAAFLAEKPYIVSRWRWPDRFNP